MKRNKARTLNLLFGAALFTACVGNTPVPETNPQTEPSTASAAEYTTEPSKGAPSASQATSSEQPENEVFFNSQALDSHRLNTPQNIPTAETTTVPATATHTAKATDPYTEIPALIQSIFDYADTLYKAGYTDSATAYLERFRVIKPLWAQWESKADSMLNEFGKTRAEKAKAYEPMVFHEPRKRQL